MRPTTRRSAARAARLAPLIALLLAACQPDVSPAPPATVAPSPVAAGAGATPTPRPTPLPAPEQLQRGLELRALGDYDGAAAQFHALVEGAPGSPEARPAAFYLAESYALRGRWTSAVAALDSFVRAGPEEAAADDLTARALFLIARGHEEAGAHEAAVAAYERYRALGTPAEPYALLRQAAQEAALGRREEAAAHYEAVALSDIARPERVEAYQMAAEQRLALGQPAEAQRLYAALLERASVPEYRARMLLAAAEAARAAGDDAQARAWLAECAGLAPAAPEALAAIEQLEADAGAAPDPALAAGVYAAHERWGEALARYDAAIAAAQGDEALELRRLRALALRSGPQPDYAGALAELAAVGAAAPDSEAGRQAQLDWVQTLGQSGEIERAIAAYREYAAAYPDDARAPEALRRAALLLDRAGDAAGAAAQRLDLGRRYPGAEAGQDALFEAGLHQWEAARPAEARQTWELLKSAAGENALLVAQAAFWAGRAAQQSGDAEGGRALLEEAIAAAPDSYYAARAADLLGQTPAGAIPLDAPIDAAAWRATEEWIASWSDAPVPDIAADGYPLDLRRHPSVLRAIALEELGLHAQSLSEWGEAQSAWRDDPAALYVLARLAHEHGAAHPALNAAAALMRLSPDGGYARAPEALRRLIFPTPYAGLVVAEAQEHGVDPRVLLALMRQESLFDPGATSWVGARGLAQVMPETGRGIAQRLQLDAFSDADLYRPVVSVRFGAFYLAQQVAAMEGSLQAGLAAYNGGLGNAQRWAGGTTVADPDAFAERIDFSETRGYVKLVYGYYGAYRRLYRWP